MMQTFGARLSQAIASHGAFCPGVDPHKELLAAWGLADNVDGLRRFAEVASEAFAGHVSMVKPQSAFFERHGSGGIEVLEGLIKALREAGTLVLLDVKRGDIGSTAQGYAEAYLNPSSPLVVDAMTASPYLGFGSLTPILDEAERHAAGVFVLALTSNPEAATVQTARPATGPHTTVAGEVLAGLSARNEAEGSTSPLGSFGAVIGATLPSICEDLGFGGPILAPGVGAQGGSAESVKRLFGDALPRVVPNSAREILRHGPNVATLRGAARRAAEEFEGLRA